MDLPVRPPVQPQLARLAHELPLGGGVLFEPKWDGFRTIVFRDGDEVVLASRSARPMTRYFPELLDPLRRSLPERVVLDGELVIAGPAGLDFDALQNRIHPAASRIRRLAAETPASFIAFDLLALGQEDLRARPFAERRARLEGILASARPPVHLTPATADRVVAEDWFRRFEGAGLDGVVAKPLALAYREGERVMIKVKHERTADCVVAGFRWHVVGASVGSLLLGLYDAAGTLHHVGVASAFTDARRRELVAELAPYRVAPGDTSHPWHEMTPGAGGRRPGARSRWNAGKDLSFEPLRPVLVAEVAYDHLQGARLRHTARFVRWRPDRDPASCTYDQFQVPVPVELATIFGAGPGTP